MNTIPAPDSHLKAPILISYRKDQGRRNNGAFFDHHVIRKITGQETLIVRHPTVDLSSFNEYIETSLHTLGIQDALGQRIIPADFMGNMNQAGLLFIPGYGRTFEDPERIKFEKKLIKKARQYGQPILAVCAGAWTLWEAYGGKVRNTTDHVYSSMPWIVKDGTVGNNKQIHRIQITDGSLVSKAMACEGNPSVNSLHWKVVDDATTPNILAVTALSVPDTALAPKNRQGIQMNPEAEAPEAFEANYGAPVIGIQWHPEAYAGKSSTAGQDAPHKRLICYMAEAGNTFMARRRMLADLKLNYLPSIIKRFMLAEFKKHYSPSETGVSCKFFKPAGCKKQEQPRPNGTRLRSRL